ncbi:hypothetical protein [Crocosphaera sp.]|nr:hypothetical protein [Crocosphaera sp.]MDJ0583074.1 hypothetical protein [Crocosphaera sp.]
MVWLPVKTVVSVFSGRTDRDFSAGRKDNNSRFAADDLLRTVASSYYID